MASKKANMTDKMAKDTDYLTPPSILDPVRRYFGGTIPLDPASTPTNPCGAVRHYFPPNHDGLSLSWGEDVTWGEVRPWGVYVNPPYGRSIRDWMEKIAMEAEVGVVVLALLPANRWEQEYFHESILTFANAACFVRSRVSFIRPSTGEVAKGNPYPSILWGLNVEQKRFTAAFDSLGHVVLLQRPPEIDAEYRSLAFPPRREPVAAKQGCAACGGTGKNSKGGICLPCSMRERGVTTRIEPFTVPSAPPSTPADPAMEGFR